MNRTDDRGSAVGEELLEFGAARDAELAVDRDEVTRESAFHQPPGRYRDVLVACYSEAVTARGPVYHEMTLSDGRRQVAWQRGLFPLSADGSKIDMLLSVTWWDKELTLVWDEFLAEEAARRG